MTTTAITYATVSPIPDWANDSEVQAFRENAVLEWHGRVKHEGLMPVGAPVVSLLEPPVIDGEPLRFEVMLDDGSTYTQPGRAWRVAGSVGPDRT